MQPAIEIDAFSKSYPSGHRQRRQAVTNLSMRVDAGSIYGFLGANGAGKTTTIKAMMGFHRPDAGSIRLFGIDVSRTESRQCVGFLPEQPWYPPFLTPRELLTIHAELAGVERSERRRAVSDAIDAAHLHELADRRLSRLSKGQTQRVGLAQALLGHPRALILDEPTSGLDPIARRQIRDLLHQLRSEGCTVFLSSHLLGEVEALCDAVTIMRRGEMVASGPPATLVRPGDRLTVRFRISGDPPESLRALLESLRGVSAGIWEAVCAVDACHALADALHRESAEVLAMHTQEETLEEAFLRLAAPSGGTA